MQYSFIFCYRNREPHLNITIPRIRALHPDAEIIVVEQDDTKKFRRANLLNEGARWATGDIFILHDIDYYPANVSYWDGQSDIYLPVKYVRFVYNDLQPKPLHEVPGGYRHFKDGVDDDFHGGVTTFTRQAFFDINGFSPQFVGWGFEDADLRERIAAKGIVPVRNDSNEFLALDHPDSGPAPHDADFLHNIQLAAQSHLHRDKGVANQPARTESVLPKHPDVDVWLMATEFDGPSNIVATSLDWLNDD
jgi:hypothetical protein